MDQQQQQQQPPPSPAWNQQPPPPQVPQQPYIMSQQPQQYSASQPQPTTTSAEEVRTLRISDLQPWMDEFYIHLWLSDHTPEEGFTSKVIRNEKTGKSECYGFIYFKTHAAAERILHKFNGTPMPNVVVVGSNYYFCLDWEEEPSFGSGGGGGEKQQLQDGSADLTISVGDDDDGTLGGGALQFPKECNEEETHGGSISTWEDMLKWWSPSLSAGTDETFILRWRSLAESEFQIRTARNLFNIETVVGAPQFPIEKPEYQTVDGAQRVRQISALFKKGPSNLAEKGVTPAKYEDLLDELIDLAGSVDIAKELHSIKGISTFLNSMSIRKQTGVKEKTAEVIIAMVHNYPTSQQLVLKVGLNFLMDQYFGDPNASFVAKILQAIYLLFRNNKPGIDLFRESKSFVFLSHGMILKCVEFQRRTLNLIYCLLHGNNSECNIVTKFGFHRDMVRFLVCSDDVGVREAALRCLFVLARVEGGDSD